MIPFGINAQTVDSIAVHSKQKHQQTIISDSTTKNINHALCSTCNGSGWIVGACFSCNGSGGIRCSSCNGSGMVYDMKRAANRCSLCNGTGHVRCTYCDGKGREEKRCLPCKGVGRIKS